MTGNRLFLFSISGLIVCSTGHIYESIYQNLIHGVVNMAIKHICLWHALVIHPVLPVVTEHRIMAQNHLALVVAELLIGFDPSEQ